MKIEINIDDNNLLTLRELTRKVKKQYVEKLLKKNNNNISKTARDLRQSQRHCIYRIIKSDYPY